MTLQHIIFCILNLIGYLTFSQNPTTDLAKTDSLLNLIKQGSDNVEIIVELYRINKNLSTDSIKSIMEISNENCKKNFKKEKINFKVECELRDIFLSDQIYRINCNFHKSKTIREVKMNDSLLQLKFSALYNDSISIELLSSKTFSTLLLHSTSTINSVFFERYFQKYSSLLNNDFSYNNLRGLMDAYIKFKYNKQYFETGYGNGLLPDNSYGLLERMSEPEFKTVLEGLNIKNPKL